MAKKKGVTIEDLARIVQKGFAEMNKKMNAGFRAVNKRLDTFEGGLSYKEHQRRIKRLEDSMQRVHDTLAIT